MVTRDAGGSQKGLAWNRDGCGRDSPSTPSSCWGRAPACVQRGCAASQHPGSWLPQHKAHTCRNQSSPCSVRRAQGKGAKHPCMQPQKGPDGAFWEQSLSSLWRHSRVATSFLNDNIQGKARQERSRLLPARTALIEWRNSLR